MNADLASHYLADVTHEFQKLRGLAERAVDQVTDDEFFSAPDPEVNSIAIVMKHLAGNLKSRWTDFLTADGEKPDRNRDDEFVIGPGTTREEILKRWDGGWSCLFAALAGLKPADLASTVHIRGEAHTVMQAIHRQLTHYAYHVGQIVLLAKDFRGSGWKTLSMPRRRREAHYPPPGEKGAG
jgi:hypothetical protein